MVRDNGIRDKERESQATGSGPVTTYKMSPEEMDEYLSRLNIKQPKNDQQTASESGSEEITKEEPKMTNRTVEKSKESLSHVMWFVDTAAPTTPIMSVNGQGIYFNPPAVTNLDCEAGECVAVGVDSVRNRLVIQVNSEGLKLRNVHRGKGLRIMNKRLVSWMKKNRIESKKYALKKDTALSVFYVELERRG